MSFYDLHLFVCCNERASDHPRPSCGLARGEAIRVAFQQQMRAHGLTRHVRVNKAGCMERCELGPCVVIYPEATWYRIDDPATDVEAIVREHLVGGNKVSRLLLPERLPGPEEAS